MAFLFPPPPGGGGGGGGPGSAKNGPHPVLLPRGEGTQGLTGCALFTVLLSNARYFLLESPSRYLTSAAISKNDNNPDGDLHEYGSREKLISSLALRRRPVTWSRHRRHPQATAIAASLTCHRYPF